MNIKNALLCCLFLLFCGCSIISTEPYHKVNYYDIGIPPTTQKISPKKKLVVRFFRSSMPYRDRMVFRTAGTDLEIDEFNRWSCPSAEMLERYLVIAFDSDADKPGAQELVLSGEVLQIEADKNRKTANLIIMMKLESPTRDDWGWYKVYKQQIPLDDITGKSFSRGIKAAVDNIIQQFVQDLKSVK